MELIVPSIKYRESFISAVKEYQENDQAGRRDIYELQVEELEKDFSSYIDKVVSESKGLNLKEGYIPQSTFWLVDNGEFIGRVSIRHKLTDHLLKIGGHIGYDIRPSKRRMGYGSKILELGLMEAKKLGIEKALITCDVTNTGSRKIIEAKGGVLDTQKLDHNSENKLRFWIDVS